jgi:hypothetical protein
MFGFPYPACESCGAFYADREAHQGFHDMLLLLYQRGFGLSDEEFERNTGQSAEERDTRILGRAEKLRLQVDADA